jgi:ornithine carbamoyltransferase
MEQPMAELGTKKTPVRARRRVDRVTVLSPYQVNRQLLETTGHPKVRFMHCMPAFHDTNAPVLKTVLVANLGS